MGTDSNEKGCGLRPTATFIVYGVIAAVAGRRIDAAGAMPPRFPSDQVTRVSSELESLLRDHVVRAVICSGASGADLIAAETSMRLGIRTRIVLPALVARFRLTSVVDRGGDWGERFDRVVARSIATDDLVVLNEADYRAAGSQLLDQATTLARASGHHSLLAVVVWDGPSRDEGDVTADFLHEAVTRGWPIQQILTTSPPASAPPIHTTLG